jgi:hypothetical protein
MEVCERTTPYYQPKRRALVSRTLVVCSFASSYWSAVTIHPRGILLGGYQLVDIG